MFALGSRVRREAGPEVVVNCLWCGRVAVRAQTLRQTEWLMLFYLVPILRLRNVFVQCGSCGKEMIAKCSLADVVHNGGATLQDHLIQRQSFVGRVSIVLGALLCWAPMIGVMPAVIGFLYRKQFGGAMRAVSWIGLIISLLTTSVGIAAMFFSHAPP